MPKLLKWLDEYCLTLFSLFLFIFIPLYPKVPILEAIPGYIVRVRVEDFIVLIAFVVFLIQVIRKKAEYKSIIFWPIVIYLIVGFLSSLSAIFITKTVPWDKIHIIKIFFHWARRIEYFSIFFIFYNGIKKLNNPKFITLLTAPILIIISIYGFGQKYLYWPVFSTMNREFSKGMKLYLTEHARVPSTFGGHYDLAAFLVMFLTLFIAFFSIFKNKVLKIIFLFTYFVSYWLLILTASRTSFIAYLISLTILFIILALKKGWLWGAPRWGIILIFSLFVMVFFGDLSERFSHFLGMPAIKDKLKLDNLLKPLKPPPTSYIALNEDIQLVMDVTDERPVTELPGSSDKSQPEASSTGEQNLPPDVYNNLPNGLVLEKSATEAGKYELRSKPRTFSENAYKYGLSTAIRFDALWPWAIEGFKKNPLLGSGYSTLNKSSVGQFTEAESTDNDYLRILGETGLLGFISFFSIIVLLVISIYKTLSLKNEYIFALSLAFIAFTVGLLVNALYIDVFEASKVAFIYWAFSGTILSLLTKKKNEKPIKK